MALARLKVAGVMDIVGDAVRNFSRNEDSNHAAAIGFYGLLALIPLFILTFVILGYLFGPVADVRATLLYGLQNLHSHLSQQLLMQLGQMEEKRRLLGGLGLVGLVWVSSMVFQSLERALNCVFRGEGRRHFAESLVRALGMMIFLWALALGFLYVSVNPFFFPPVAAEVSPSVAEALGFGFFWKYILPQFLVVVAVALVYRIVPQNPVPLGTAVAGGVFVAIGMNVAKWVFSGYLDWYARYGLIYGSFDVLVILVLWVYYLSLIFLFGAELLSSYQRRDVILLEKVILGKKGERMRRTERVYRKFGRIYGEGSCVFRDGDKGKDLYFILKGGVALEKKSREITRTLARVGKGDYFGEMALLADIRRTASARVLEPSLIAVIPAKTFRAILRESGDVSLLMLKEFSRRLKNTVEMLDDVSQLWMRLLLVAHMLLKEENLPWDKGELAREASETSGSDRAEILALLLCLQDEGCLSGNETEITAIDRGQLRKRIAAHGDGG